MTEEQTAPPEKGGPGCLAQVAMILISTLIIILGLEFAAMTILSRTNSQKPFLVNIETDPFRNAIPIFLPHRFVFNRLDPHLGFAHSNSAIPEENLPKVPYTIMSDGMVAYYVEAETPVEDYPRPLIVALGGSTTDAIMYETSWPEELAKLMQEQGQPGTVINGGVGAYSSAQELIKLMRDVVPLQPDLVISYNGINDLGNWALEGHPMVHPYQQKLFESIMDMDVDPYILPNTVGLFERLFITPRAPSKLNTPEYGTEVYQTPGENWMHQVGMMQAISAYAGADFLHVMQPAGGLGSFVVPEETIAEEMDEGYLEALTATYDYARQVSAARDYALDLSMLFDGLDYAFDEIYLEDARHLQPLGNAMVAEAIYAELRDRDLIAGG